MNNKRLLFDLSFALSRDLHVSIQVHITNQQRMSLVGELGDRRDKSQRSNPSDYQRHVLLHVHVPVHARQPTVDQLHRSSLVVYILTSPFFRYHLFKDEFYLLD